MKQPLRLRRSRAKGARLGDENGLPTTYVGRGTVFGNPFRVGVNGNNADCMDKYRRCLDAVQAGEWSALPSELRVEALKAVQALGRKDNSAVLYFYRINVRLPELRGHNLVCWCPLLVPCHAGVLLQYANKPQE